MYMEKKEFKKIVDRYSDTLFRVAYTYCGNRGDAEDIVQDTFSKYLKKHPEFESEKSEKAWLISTAIKLCKNYLKSYWFKKRGELTENIEIKEKDKKIIWKCVGKLSPKYRIIIELYYKERYSIEEIAELLCENQLTVSNQFAQGKKLLEKMLKEDMYE